MTPQNNERPYVHVEFFEDTKLNKRKSDEQGRPIHDTVDKIRIRYVGDPKTVLVAPAHSKSIKIDGMEPTYAERFPDHWKAYKEDREFHGDGTPLAELRFLSAGKCKELQAVNIRTAEDLASLDGAMLTRLGMGARELKNQAQAYLDSASGNADVIKLAGQNAALQDQMEALKAEMARMQAQTAPAEDEKVDVSDSPFNDMDNDTIRVWMTENGGEAPHHKCSRETIIQKATALNDKIRRDKEAA